MTYHVGETTSQEDRARFFSSNTVSHAVVLEHRWLEPMRHTTLYLYEFDPDDFVLQDDVAGYYVAKTAQVPKAKHPINDLFLELIQRNVEIRMTDTLWDIADAVQKSTLNWSLCRMGFATPRK